MRHIILLFFPFCAFLSCGKSIDQKVSYLAHENLKLSTENAEKLKVLGVSKVDSAFGVNYFTEKEIRSLFEITKKVSEQILKKTNNLTSFDHADPAMMSLIERQMRSSTEVRNLLLNGKKKGKFSGYKMKIDYQCEDGNGISYKAERWFFVDETGGQILRTFEIPLP